MLAIPRKQELYDTQSDLPNGGVLPGTEEVGSTNGLVAVLESSGIVVIGVVYLVPGPGTTGITIRIHEGYGTGGQIVWEVPNIAVTAGKLTAIPISGIITATSANVLSSTGGQFTTSFQQVGATGNGTFNQLFLNWFNTRRTVADPEAMTYF